MSVYKRMQDIDRRLRGEGYPERISPRDINNEIKSMESKLDDYYSSSINSVEHTKKNKNLLSFSDAFDLKPGVSRISVDLRKIWQWGKEKLKIKPNK